MYILQIFIWNIFKHESSNIFQVSLGGSMPPITVMTWLLCAWLTHTGEIWQLIHTNTLLTTSWLKGLSG